MTIQAMIGFSNPIGKNLAYGALDKGAGGLILVLLFLFFLFRKKRPTFFLSPSLAFSQIKNFSLSSWRSRLFFYPTRFYQIGFLSFLIAFIDPHFLSPVSPSFSSQTATEGLALYFVLDRSGSMSESVSITNAEGERQSLPKIDWLKKVTEQFIRAHPTDLIGLVTFARLPQVIVPLTLDQQTLLTHLKNLKGVVKPEEDGSAIGYAILKTAHLITATRHFAEERNKQENPLPYTIQSSVMIVVTDGFQNPSRLDQGNRLRTIDLEEAAQMAKKQGVRLYIINVDPNFGLPAYAPHRHQMQQITRLTGGDFYLVDTNQDLKTLYDKIDQLEKGKIVHPGVIKDQYERRFSLYPFFIISGLSFLAAALLLDLWVLKVIP